jgi:hypothetical protein
VAAWYVCEGQGLWINLGAYLYGTPGGCVDQTVSFFCFDFVSLVFDFFDFFDFPFPVMEIAC